MLKERDARQLVSAIVRELRLLGATVRRAGVQRDGEGLLFLADLNGRLVVATVPAGTTPYRLVAVELLAASLTTAGASHGLSGAAGA